MVVNLYTLWPGVIFEGGREILMNDDFSLPANIARRVPCLHRRLQDEPGSWSSGDTSIVEALEQRCSESVRARASLTPVLVDVRALQTAGAGIPSVFDGVRRTRLLDADLVSSTWEAWDVTTGRALVVRCLRPETRLDPVWRRRLEWAADEGNQHQGVWPAKWYGDGEWPHLRYAVAGVPMSALLPLEDPPAPQEVARLACRMLSVIEGLHERGVLHGGPLAEHVWWSGMESVLLWLDPVRATPIDRTDDFRGLGATLADLDPRQEDRVAVLGAEWSAVPPEDVPSAEAALRTVMAAELTGMRHRLFWKARHDRPRVAAARLYSAMKALRRVAGPPPALACLHASADGVLTIAHSEKGRLFGGTVATPTLEGLPALHAPGVGLDARGSRALIRAWMRRRHGDEARRLAAQEALGGSDEDAQKLIQWILASAQLRTLLMLSEATWLEGIARSA